MRNVWSQLLSKTTPTHPHLVGLALVEEVEWFDAEHPRDTHHSHHHQHHMEVTLQREREEEREEERGTEGGGR